MSYLRDVHPSSPSMTYILLAARFSLYSCLRWPTPLIFRSLFAFRYSFYSWGTICKPYISNSLFPPSYWNAYLGRAIWVGGSPGWWLCFPPDIAKSTTTSERGRSVWRPTPESDYSLNKQTVTYGYLSEVYHFREEGEGCEVDFFCINTSLRSHNSYRLW